LEDVSESVQQALTFHFVSEIDQVLDLAFGHALRDRVPATQPPLPGEPVVTVVTGEDVLPDPDSEGDVPVVQA